MNNYEEKIIDGELCSRRSESEEWVPISNKRLTIKITALYDLITHMQSDMDDLCQQLKEKEL